MNFRWRSFCNISGSRGPSSIRRHSRNLRAGRYLSFMIRIAIGVFIFLGLPLGAVKADDYPEVLFSNSVMPGNYGHSLVAYSGFSWVENVKGRVPLADTLYFTPGNSLSLKYTSSIRGLWELSVYYPVNNRFQPDPSQHELSFYAYATEGLEFDALPQVV